jgi:hypothetical protein
MASQPGTGKTRADTDGRPSAPASGLRPSVLLLVLAMGLIGTGAVIVGVRMLMGAAADEPQRPAPSARELARDTAVDARSDAIVAETDPVPPQDDVAALPEQAASTGNGDAEEREGIWVFPPRGTSPPMPGLVVPDDFELPPGYVRHYQTTDDGRQLEPILMYHPNRQPVDERGEPLPQTPDRVVPQERAPVGLPIEMLEVPETELPEDFDAKSFAR